MADRRNQITMAFPDIQGLPFFPDKLLEKKVKDD